MVRRTEAIYENGVLTPTEPLPLAEHQRVRITVEEIPLAAEEDRAAALARFRASVEKLSFCSTGPYPRREELYDRRHPE